MKSIFIILYLLSGAFQAPQNKNLEKDNGLLPYQLGMEFNPNLGLKFVKKSGNTIDYKGGIHLKTQANSIEEVTSSFYKGRLMAFSINIRNAARAKAFCNYLHSKYGNGVKDKDEYQISDEEITTWSSPTVTIQTLINKKTGATWIDFVSETMKKRYEADPTTKFPEI